MYFPIMMSAYAVFYSAWWPFAWGYVGAGVLALDAQVSWLVVFAVAGVGGAVAILCYAVYMAWAYRRLCERAGVPFPLGTQRDLD